MERRSLDDTVAVLTGSSAGIALEIACQFAEAGACGVVLNGRSCDTGAAAVAAVKACAPACDVRFVAGHATDPGVVARLVGTSIGAFGRIDILVNSVGGGLSPRPFSETRRAPSRSWPIAT